VCCRSDMDRLARIAIRPLESAGVEFIDKNGGGPAFAFASRTNRSGAKIYCFCPGGPSGKSKMNRLIESSESMTRLSSFLRGGQCRGGISRN